MLGSWPADPAIRQTYIISRAPTDGMRELEKNNDFDVEAADKQTTVFVRNPKMRDCLCLRAHQITGMLKEAMDALEEQTGIKLPRGKVDRYVFVDPIYIPIKREGQLIFDEDDVLERPLRGQTPKGPRVALAGSEMILDPWSVEFEVTLLPNKGTPKSKPLEWDDIETALNYGLYKGLLQWRNGGWGRFRWYEDESQRLGDDSWCKKGEAV